MGHAAEAVQHGHGGHDGHEAWGTSVWPFVISFGVLALAAAFMFQLCSPCRRRGGLHSAWVSR
ncbi:MAG: hypothetical protein IPF74_00435 [Rhodocyclaceae bacterium]|nr:hypothetical protein [Rhodocyclaceae bacterium]